MSSYLPQNVKHNVSVYILLHWNLDLSFYKFVIPQRLHFWKLRNLNLKGEVLILNVLMVSKLWYVLYVSEIPLWAEQRLKKCFLDFLWEGKPARIAHNTILGAVEKGGLGLMDVEQRKNALRVKIAKFSIPATRQQN